ncbi:xaa-Pro aminopeptidase 1-like isoform X1 [Neodiprion fabricii]|uniref:xaa-Pro aminopeptidase 1-like isoform X1 n=2 Tax=Neodiprion fabricii TaxID=2872261 RepID=UPI001ED90C0F|nr:xaa-Pro aminopeptidase 1-like isoform X1 [Neodiprion fabricii]
MHRGAFVILLIYASRIGVPVETHPVISSSKENTRISEDVAAQRLSLLREQMNIYGIDAYIITTADVHQSEYIANRDMRRSWISGYTGSAGTAVVTLNEAALWTDSRYYEQATLQLSDDWVLMKSGLTSTPSLQVWLTTVLAANTTVGTDPEITTYSQWTTWNAVLAASNISLLAVEDNLIDIIWTDQPAYPMDAIFDHPIEFAGLSREEKLANARIAMAEADVDLYVITALDEVAWLTNLRGSDIPNTPVFRSYLLITNETATIYIPSPETRLNETLIEDLTAAENSSFAIADYENIWEDLEIAGELATAILLPAPYSYALGISYRVYTTVPSSKVKSATSPVLLVKDRKTEVEANGMRNAHIKDAVALCQFLYILEEAINNGEEYDELRAVEELSALRAAQAYNFGDSFDTIAGYAANSALPHYTPTNETNVVIGTNSTFMLDSGGQYYDGTTDVTRSMHYGTPTEEQRDTYTALLAGCIDLARLIFPVGQSYSTTDLLMRSQLYRLGRNYGHGSTHGVGYFLSVHEAWNTTYDVNFFGSQEPGYYQEGSWGMRLENLVVVVPANTTYDPEETFLTFETVTLVPYARNLIDETKLSDDQLSWLNEYHATVRLKVGAELLRQGHNATYDWLVEQTKPITRPRNVYRRFNFVALP